MRRRPHITRGEDCTGAVLGPLVCSVCDPSGTGDASDDSPARARPDALPANVNRQAHPAHDASDTGPAVRAPHGMDPIMRLGERT